jgi:hypothetical protein
MLFGKKKSHDEEYVSCCGLCEYAVAHEEEGYMLCSKKGKVEKMGTCRKFSYDITKRIPKKRPEKFSFEE